MFVFIAQGGGFYGSAFYTEERDFDYINERLQSNLPDVYVMKDIQRGSIFLGPDTNVIFKPWEGNAQDDPVVLFDTGHKQEDLDALNKIKSLLA